MKDDFLSETKRISRFLELIWQDVTVEWKQKDEARKKFERAEWKEIEVSKKAMLTAAKQLADTLKAANAACER